MSNSPTLFLALALLAFAGSLGVAFIGSRSAGRHSYRRDCRARALSGFSPVPALPFDPPAVPATVLVATHSGRVSPNGAAAPKTSATGHGAGRALLLDVAA